jgi:glutamate 5-kinase
VVRVRGTFDRGDLVSCLGPLGKEFARGLVNYSASELERIKGLRSEKIEQVLGYKYSDEVIHRDDLVVL